MGAADQEVLRLTASCIDATPPTGLLDDEPRDRFLGLIGGRLLGKKLWNAWIRGHWRIENGSHHVRDTTFAEDASRIRKNPTSQRAYAPSPIICRAHEAKTSKMPDGARARSRLSARYHRQILRTEQPCLQPGSVLNGNPGQISAEIDTPCRIGRLVR